MRFLTNLDLLLSRWFERVDAGLELTSFYDALYLELALRTSAHLATLDTSLRRAAAKEGIPVLTA